jgi:hypothetical protein
VNYLLNTGCGGFLNAEGTKVTQRTQNKTEKKIQEKFKVIVLRLFFEINFESILVFLLRPLRNLRALCVQKFPYPSSSRAANTL